MTSDKDRDKELVEKKRATNTVKHLFGQGAMAVCAAIDALKPEPVCQDPVSKKMVLEIVGEEVDWHPMATRIEKLPSILPAPGRSEEEIIRKIKTFLSYPWAGDRFRNEISKLFSAPDLADKKGGTGETG